MFKKKRFNCNYLVYSKIHYYENVKTYLDNAYKHLISLIFGLDPHKPIFKHGFTRWEQTTNEINLKLNITPKWAPLGFKNNLLNPYNLGENLPRSDRAAMKSTLTLLLPHWFEGGFLQYYPIPNLFSTK
jgi:hypothetical protein